MPLVSVGLPVRNGARLIRFALDSILSQTHRDFELVISDNRSEDETADICREYATLDNRVRYYRQRMLVPPAENHNYVLSHSTGTFFKWASYDDVCHPEFLSRCLQPLHARREVVLAYPRTTIIDGDGDRVQDYDYRLKTESPYASVRFGSLLRADHRRYAAFEVYGLIRSAALWRAGPMGNFVSADRVLLTRLALLGRFAEVPDYLFFSREHAKRSVRTLPHGIGQHRKWLRRLVGVGALPPLEWWDPSKAGYINFPEWRLIREYRAAVNEAPLSISDKALCLGEIAQWVGSNIPKLGRDVILAGEQLISGYRLVGLRRPGVVLEPGSPD